jgi:antibiotic biosynthesis monooxygenase
MKHLPMGWLLPAAVLLGFTMPGTAAHTTEKEANMKSGKTAKVTAESIVRLSRITVDPARLAEYLVFATECGRRSMAEEPGVLMMYSMQDKAHPEQITILEIYADSAAYERHIKTPHFQKYKQGTLAMVRKLELLDQTPLVPEMKMK